MKETVFIIREVLGGAGDLTEFEVWKCVRRVGISGKESWDRCGKFSMEWQARLEIIRQVA